MKLLEIFHEKQSDIVIGLAIMVLGLILGVIIDVLRKKNSINVHSGTPNFNSNISITNIINTTNEYKSKNGKKEIDDQLIWAIILATIVITFIIYSFCREQILIGTTYTPVAVLSIFIGKILHSLTKGYYRGFKWKFYAAFTFIFCIVSLFVVSKASSPNHAPNNLVFLQDIVLKDGIKELPKFFSPQDLRWITFHVLGINLLILANFTMVLSNIHFAIMGDHLYKNASTIPWLARKIKLYDNYSSNFIYVSILLMISYFLINGDIHEWFFFKLPTLMSYLIEIVVNGKS
jgi:multisubunit Na+/H+ antiporter MnhC subunit